MTYVDSDGVLANFEGWVKSIDPNAYSEGKKTVRNVIVNNYKRCFLDSKPLKCGETLMYLVATHPEYYVLTSLPSYKGLKKYLNLSSDEIVSILTQLKENKYKWFEQQGVPRNKVIIVDKREDKLSYCYNGDVLYDDYPDTIAEWNNSGGVGVLVNCA